MSYQSDMSTLQVIDLECQDSNRDQESVPEAHHQSAHKRKISFSEARKALLFSLEICQCYQSFLQSEDSVARHMSIPLMSDVLAEKISHLFSQPQPRVMDSEGNVCDIESSWMDVIRQWPFHAEKYHDNYRFSLANKIATFEITQFDYDLILSGIPQKLVHPRSHANDILAEAHALNSLTSEMRMWEKVATNSKLTLGCILSIHKLN